MPNLPYNPDHLTFGQVREIAALVGHELSPARVAAVRARIAESGSFDAALCWAGGNCDQQVARDIRTIHAGLYLDLDCVRRNLEGTAAYEGGLPESRAAARRRLAVMDGALMKGAA
jgi:hypothetical protein